MKKRLRLYPNQQRTLSDLHIKIPLELKREIENISEAEGLVYSEGVRFIISIGVRIYDLKNKTFKEFLKI